MRLAVLSLALAFLGACEDNGEPPDGTVDPNAAVSAVDSVVTTFFDDNDAITGLTALGPLITGIVTQPTVVPSARLDEGTLQALGPSIAAALDRAREREVLAGPALSRIPSPLLGVTFVWDLVQRKYIIDPNDPGLAPANGIWFRLYTIDPGTGEPAAPLDDIGYLEIIDDSSLPSVNVGINGFIDGVGSLINYDVTGTLGSPNISLNMAGFVGDGTDQLDFNFLVSGSTSTFFVNFSLSVGSFIVTFDFIGDDTGAAQNTVLIANTSTEDLIEFTFNFDALGNITAGSGVRFNGVEVVVISGTADAASIMSVNGSPLSLAAIAQLFNGIQEVFGGIADLFIFGLGVTGNVIFTTG
jgi:hypothetical protein